MAIVTLAIQNFVVVLLIGIIAGLLFNRYGTSWVGRQVATRHNDLTAALVGIAGAFIGFHIGVILALLPSPLMFYLTAVIGAALTLWIWRSA